MRIPLIATLFLLIVLAAGTTLFITQLKSTETHEASSLSATTNTSETSTTQTLLNLGTFKKMDHDPYGVWAREGSHVNDIDPNHLSVYASTKSPYFFAVYTPTETPQRTIVSLHGTDGTAYASIHDEMEAAESMQSTIIAIQWLDFKNGAYADTNHIEAVIDAAYNILQDTLNGKNVLMGFSRGSAMIFKVAADDAANKKRFVGVVANSGGIPENGLIEQRNATTPKDEMYTFYSALNTGTAQKDLFTGQHFFLYCGMKDEQWGTEMCDMMNRANTLVPNYGGTIDVFIQDAEGGHMGLTRTATNYEQFLTWLKQITE